MAYELAKAYIQIIPTTKGIGGAIENELAGAGDNAGKKAGSKFGSSFGGALKAVGKATAASLVAGVGAMTAFTKSSVEAGMSFDASMSQVAATMGKTMGELESDIQTVNVAGEEWTGNLREYAKKMGAETRFSATEAADALNYMALAGYNTKTSMQMLPNVLNLAAAGNMELAAASDMVTDTQSALGLTLEETNAMVDQMAKASSKSNTSVAQLGDAMLKIGATARQVKGGTQELSTMLGVLADNGIKGSEGGTHLRNILLSLQNAAKGGKVAFGDFSVDLYDADGNMRSLIDVTKEAKTGLSALSEESKSAVLGGIFNKTDLAAINALIGTESERFDELSQAIGDSAKAAQEMADTQLDNLTGDITIMKSAFEGLQIAVSDGATPAIREAVKGITEVINGMNDLVSGVDGGAGRIEAGFAQIMRGVNDAVPAILRMFSSVMSAVLKMLPELISSIVQMLPELFNQIVTAVSDMIPQLARILPDLIRAVISLAVNLVSHLSEIITPIIQAIPSIIKSFVSGLIQNLPTLIQGILDLVVSIATELPEICSEIVEYIPELFVQLAKAIVLSIPKIMAAVGELVGNIIESLLGIEDPVEAVGRKMEGLGESARNAWSEISQALNQEVDVSGLLSSMGRTTKGIQTEIDDLEGQITEILSARLQEQEGLRQEDIRNIENYMQRIRELEEEKLSIYGGQADAQLEILGRMTNATAEQYMEQLGKLQAYDAQQKEELENFHNSQYVEAQNQKTAMLALAEQYLEEGGTKEDAEYTKRIAAAQKAYEELTAEADSYYTEHLAKIEDRESKALDIVTNSGNLFVADMNATYAKVAEAGEMLNASTDKMAQGTAGAYYAAQYAQQTAFSSMINSMDDATVKSTSAWLNLVAEAKAKGTELSENTEATAQNILGAFKNMPDSLKSKGTDILRGLTNGMEGHIPELKNASEMSAEEIVTTIEHYLGIASPSRVMRQIGDYTIQGLVQGILATGRQAGNSMYQIGAMLMEGIGQGMQSRSAWLNSIAANAVRGAINAGKEAGEIRSPSRVTRKEIGQMLTEGTALGILDGKGAVTGAINELSASMRKASEGMELQAALTGQAAILGATDSMRGITAPSGVMALHNGSGTNGVVFYITNNIDGTENPEEFASRLIRQIQLEMRMA